MPLGMYSTIHLLEIMRLSAFKSPLFYPSSQVGLLSLRPVLQPADLAPILSPSGASSVPPTGTPPHLLWPGLSFLLRSAGPLPSESIVSSLEEFSSSGLSSDCSSLQALFSAILSSLGLSAVPQKAVPESLGISCCSLQSSYLEPTVPPLARRLSVSTSS